MVSTQVSLREKVDMLGLVITYPETQIMKHNSAPAFKSILLTVLFSKSRTKSDSIPLRENGKIISEDKEVSNIFNSFFQEIGSDIGFPENNDRPLNEINEQYKEHESLKVINDRIRINRDHNCFIFRFVTEREVTKLINSLSSKKASGYDEIPAQFIKKLRHKLARPLTALINRCILENTFPSGMKKANITPLFKKKDKLNKDNYRSVNLLPILSKIMERALYNQIYEYMTPLFHKYLSGFRKGHSCQDVLIRMTEDWREALDKGFKVGVIAIDLSKAFDCMPHGLLLAKLSAYGFDINACELMKSYIMERQQRVKIGETFSDWVCNIKGVPQGSILGPLLFNVFVNDFLFLNFNSKIYNYADDNTLSCTEMDQTILEEKLKEDCVNAMKWFELNSMKANASKFQLMFLDRQNTLNSSITVGGSDIKATKSVNVLGVELDENLKFKTHIDEICGQAGKQINALKRIKHYLDRDSKKIIYNSYINSNFNFCSVVWMFSCKTQLEKIEKTNKRALRFVTNEGHLSYEEICTKEKQLTVYKRCVKNAAITMYKIRRGIAPQYLNEMFVSQDSHYDMRDDDKYRLTRYNTITYGKHSFRYYGAKLWNNIPTDIKRSVSLNTFKTAITQWLLTCEESSTF
jgi:hypothetical protein